MQLPYYPFPSNSSTHLINQSTNQPLSPTFSQNSTFSHHPISINPLSFNNKSSLSSKTMSFLGSSKTSYQSIRSLFTQNSLEPSRGSLTSSKKLPEDNPLLKLSKDLSQTSKNLLFQMKITHISAQLLSQSNIIHTQFDAHTIQKFFPFKIKDFKLLYRANEHKFIIKKNFLKCGAKKTPSQYSPPQVKNLRRGFKKVFRKYPPNFAYSFPKFFNLHGQIVFQNPSQSFSENYCPCRIFQRLLSTIFYIKTFKGQSRLRKLYEILIQKPT